MVMWADSERARLKRYNCGVGDNQEDDAKAKESSRENQVRVVDRRWWARQDAEEPADEGGARKPSYVEDLERQVAEQGAQLQKYLAEHRLALHEFEQVKSRIRRDVSREVERGKRALLGELLEVVDNLDRALSAAQVTDTSQDAAANIARGVELVREQFLAKLAGFGVRRVDPLGQPFDATQHEAVTTTPVDAAQDGVIVAVVKPGYTIVDEILRPASVVVGRAQ
jgi:molecular chaperone GrpE